MIEILTWTAYISGGLLFVLLLLSLIGGLDLDLDIGGDADADHGGLGLLKGGLTLVAVGTWVARIMLVAKQHPILALLVGTGAGVASAWFLKWMFSALLKNEANTNWSPSDALLQEAKVYLRVPAESGYGLINVDIRGVTRELKAISGDQTEIATGERVVVQHVKDDIATVLKVDPTTN